MRRLFAVAVMLLFGAEAAHALDPAAQRGLTFVETNCAHCHAIGRYDQSPLPVAPPFRTFHERFDVERLRQSLALGTISDHPSMPQFTLDPGEIDDVIAYLKTLEAPRD